LSQQVQGPVYLYRPVGEDCGYEGPIHNSQIEKVRSMGGTWVPLFAGTALTAPLPAQPAQPVQPVQVQWLQSVTKKIEAALLSHRLSLHKDAEDDGVGYPLVDALCCGQTTIENGKREVKDIVETIYHVLDANTSPTPAAQPVQPAQGPVAWAVYWGNELKSQHSLYRNYKDAQTALSEIKSFQAGIRPLVFGDTPQGITPETAELLGNPKQLKRKPLTVDQVFELAQTHDLIPNENLMNYTRAAEAAYSTTYPLADTGKAMGGEE